MLFIKRGQDRCCSRNAAEFGKKTMSDNIRNKAIFEIKIAKIAQNLPKIDILQIWLWRCTMGMFLLTLQKNSVSLSFIVTEIWPRQNTNSKSGFLAKTSKLLAKLNFDFLLHNFSRYVIFGIFCNFFAQRVLGDMARTRKRYRQTDGRTHGRTDGRTYTEGKTIYVSRRGRHIMNSKITSSAAILINYALWSIFFYKYYHIHVFPLKLHWIDMKNVYFSTSQHIF